MRGLCAVTVPVRLPRSQGPQEGFCLRRVWGREGPSARLLLVCVLPALSHSCPRQPRGEALPAPHTSQPLWQAGATLSLEKQSSSSRDA